jgi:hypothetical protein
LTTGTASIKRVHFLMMVSPFDAKAFPQYGSGTTPHKLFVQQTDASLIALLTDAID